MSTPPDTPSPRILAREAAGLLLVAIGVLVVLIALGAVHPALSTSVAAVGTFAVFRFLAPPKTKVSRAVAYPLSAIVAAAAVGSAFVYFPFLGWVEVGAAVGSTGAWLASEGA